MFRRNIGKGKLMGVGHTFYLSRGDAGEVVGLYMDFNFKNRWTFLWKYPYVGVIIFVFYL